MGMALLSHAPRGESPPRLGSLSGKDSGTVALVRLPISEPELAANNRQTDDPRSEDHDHPRTSIRPRGAPPLPPTHPHLQYQRDAAAALDAASARSCGVPAEFDSGQAKVSLLARRAIHHQRRTDTGCCRLFVAAAAAAAWSRGRGDLHFDPIVAKEEEKSTAQMLTPGEFIDAVVK